ncbi:MAG: oxidoreductase [Candidatus Heimdallarchaeaceae archaeon]
MAKIKTAIVLGATCAGCDVAILDLNEKILEVADLCEFVFWPTAMDFKIDDLLALEDGEVDIGIYHGSIRTEEDKEMAEILRRKAKVVVAFGACANFGGIPSLNNMPYEEGFFDLVYKQVPSMDNPKGTVPLESVEVKGEELTLPGMRAEADALGAVIDVDYYVPGCPPMVPLIEKLFEVVKTFAETGELPPKGTVIAGEGTLCDECGREKPDVISLSEFFSPHEKDSIDPDTCLLTQGIICMGPATRSGCGALCTNMNVGCRGCMGPTAKVKDHGLKMISAITSLLEVAHEEEMSEEELDKVVERIPDPLGTFYRFTYATSLISKLHPDKKEDK